MSVFDSKLEEIRIEQERKKVAYAKVQAQIEAQERNYEDSLIRLNKLGCATLEDAENRVLELTNLIETELEDIKRLLS